MTVAPERLAAFADGELEPGEARAVERELERSPELRAQLAAHRALKARLGERFDPILRQPLPRRLVDAVHATGRGAEVIDFASVRQQREGTPSRFRWWWVAGPALAASIALVVIAPRSAQTGYAGHELASALDRQLIAEQEPDAPVRILLSFRDRTGRYCRGYAREDVAGYACRDDDGWRIGKEVAAPGGSSGEYRQASAPPAALMAAIQDAAAGSALDAAEERRAEARGWRD